jgi:hypothetical protein
MKSRIALAVPVATIAALLITAALVAGPSSATPLNTQPTLIPTTIPYGIQAPGANAVDINFGGVFRSGIAVELDANEPALVILPYATQTSDLVNVYNTSGTEVLAVESDGELVALGVPRWDSKAITYTAAAGGSGNAFVFPANQTFIIHDMFFETTTNWTDTSGNDETVKIGDAATAAGYLDLEHNDLLTTVTKPTEVPVAGWSGYDSDELGVYLDAVEAKNGVIVTGATVPYTVTYTIACSGDDCTAGAGTIYVRYTRIE